MLRTFLAIIAGLVAWVLVATVINLAFRFSWPAYAAVEASMVFTVSMLAMRVAVGAVASLCAGLVVALVGARRTAAFILAVVLLIFFLPVHYGLWDRFPIWYHLVFLASLVVLPPLGYLARGGPRSTRSPA